MEDITITVPVNSANKFTIILKVLSIFKPFSELREAELRVYAELLKLNEKYKGLSIEDKNTLVFSADNKKKIISDLELPKNSFYNILLSLRQKGILDHDKFIERYLIKDTSQIIYKLHDPKANS